MRNSNPLRSLLTSLALIAAVGGSEYATAADDNPSGPYVGAGYGQFNEEIEDIEGLPAAIGDLDSDDGAWKAFFGWRFNPFISAEIDYIDLGNPRGNFDASGSSGQYTTELSGVAAYVIGTFPITIFELSAKVGYYFHDVTIEVDFDNVGAGNGDVIESDDNGEALVYGVGAGVTLFEHLNAKVEYELMEIDNLEDAYTLWLSGAWRF